MPNTNAEDQDQLPIDVWSDVMCPFCYMGDRLLARALEQFPHAEHVDVRYRSYQLMPHLSADRAIDLNELLVREKGLSRERAEALHAQVAERGKAVGIDYRFERALAVNTRAAHRLSHFARQHGKQRALMLRLFSGYFTDGLHLGEHAVLADLAAEVGLDRAAALEALESGAFEADVSADEEQARELGIGGVPFFVLDGKYAVHGAQPVGVFLEALHRGWSERKECRADEPSGAPAAS